MNANQFHYINQVLKVSSILRPSLYRSIYQIYSKDQKQTDFLFFVDHLESKEKSLLSNMAKALNCSHEMIIQIKNTQNHFIPAILNHFLTRFRPNGFVVFGPVLFEKLYPPSASQNTDTTLKKIEHKVAISSSYQLKIPGCVLYQINDFTQNTNKSILLEKKSQSWELLKKTFNGII